MPKFNLGWLKDKNGEKFAPKTFTTQVLDDTGKKNLKEILENTEEKIEEKIKNKIDSPTAAEVGQQLIVKDVDENGTPIDWECVERPCYIEEKLLFDKYLDIKDVGVYGDFTYYYSEDEKFTLVVDKEYKVIIDGYVHDETCYDDNGKPCIYVSMNQYVTIYEDYLYGDFNNCSFQIIEINTKQLDESLIPDNMFIKEPMSSGSNGDVLISDGYGNAYWSNNYVKPSDLNSYAKTTRYATSSQAGLVRTSTSYGTKMSGQYIQTDKATTSDISSKSNQYKPIVPYNLDEAVRYGLGASKITWTEAEKTKARSVIGAISASDIPEVEPQVQADYEETNSSSVSYIKNKTHYDTRRLVEINEQINYGGYNTYGNITSDLYDLFINKTVDGLLVDGKTISYASEYINNKYGYLIYDLSDNRQLIVNAYSTRAYVMDNSSLDGSIAGTLTVTGSGNCGSFKQLDEKYIPDNIPKISTATVGQTLEIEEIDENGKPTKWKAVDKSEGTDLDVQINGESIVENGVANIPLAGYNLGLVKNFHNEYSSGLAFKNDGSIKLAESTEGLQNRMHIYAVTSKNYDLAVKLAMCDGKGAEWTEEEKQAARERIGAGTGSGGGIDGTYVESVEQTTTSTVSGGTNIVTVTKSDGSTNEVEILNGKDGRDGKDGVNGLTPHIDNDGYIVYGEGKLDEVLEEIERLKDIASSVTYDENTGDLTISSYIYSYDETTGNLII